MIAIGYTFLSVFWIILICLIILSIMEVNGKTIMVRRCAWHKRNFGWVKYMGFKFGKYSKDFGRITDGICNICKEKL